MSNTLSFVSVSKHHPNTSLFMDVPANSLQVWALAAAGGDPRAQRKLYERLYPYGMNIALHYAGHQGEAEEIVQDAFFKLFVRLTKAPLTGSLRAYFSQVVINTAIDLLRKRSRTIATEEINERTLNAHQTARNLGVDLIQQEEAYTLLRQLPPAYRAVFNMYVLEGYTHQEIADRLDVSVGTSKSNLHKARRKMRLLAAQFYQITDDASTK